VGAAALHLNLSLDTWAADGLLAILFVAGPELEREFVAGDRRALGFKVPRDGHLITTLSWGFSPFTSTRPGPSGP
jgi:hypothetical protein